MGVRKTNNNFGDLKVGEEAVKEAHEKKYVAHLLDKQEIEWVLMKIRGLKYPPEEFQMFTKVFAKLAEAYEKRWYLFKSFIGPGRGSGLNE